MSVLATDTFDRADTGTLGANWTAQSGETTQDIFSNQASNPTSVSARGNYYSAIAWPDDHYSQAVINTLTANEDEVSVRCRCATAARTYYAGGASFRDFANDNHRIWKVVAGVFTSITTEAVVYSPGSTYRLEVQGTALRLYKDGVLRLSTTDGAITTGNAGLGGQGSSIHGLLSNNWEGGDFNSGATSHNLAALGVGT